MAWQQKDMSGTLFKETEKRNERGPDYQGMALIDGVAYRMAAWVRDGRNGKFLSIAFSEPRGGQRRQEKPKDDPPPAQSQSSQNADDIADDDGLPF